MPEYHKIIVCVGILSILRCYFFFFNDPATTEIYTLSLHDALPISRDLEDLPFIAAHADIVGYSFVRTAQDVHELQDRKSTRLNSSHSQISYAVFCLKKKKNN